MLEAKVQEAWRVLRIQSELVDGTDKLLKLGAAVTVFGGARLDSSNRYYREAQLLGKLLVRKISRLLPAAVRELWREPIAVVMEPLHLP